MCCSSSVSFEQCIVGELTAHSALVWCLHAVGFESPWFGLDVMLMALCVLSLCFSPWSCVCVKGWSAAMWNGLPDPLLAAAASGCSTPEPWLLPGCSSVYDSLVRWGTRDIIMTSYFRSTSTVIGWPAWANEKLNIHQQRREKYSRAGTNGKVEILCFKWK